MVKNRGEGKTATGGEAHEELVRELRHLRALVREVGENHILRQEGEIEAAIENLEVLPSRRLRTLVPALMLELRKLKVRPAKGRFRDLKELKVLIDEVSTRVGDAQDQGKAVARRKPRRAKGASTVAAPVQEGGGPGEGSS